MKKSFASIVLLCLLGFLSCNSDQELQKKETLPPQSEKMGQEVVKMIKTPLEQARKIADQENSHSQTVEKQLGKQ